MRTGIQNFWPKYSSPGTSPAGTINSEDRYQESILSRSKHGRYIPKSQFYSGTVSSSHASPPISSSKVCKRFSTFHRLFNSRTQTSHMDGDEKSWRSWALHVDQSLHSSRQSYIPVLRNHSHSIIQRTAEPHSAWNGDRNPRSLHSFHSVSGVMCCIPFGIRSPRARTPRRRSTLRSPGSVVSWDLEDAVNGHGLLKTLPKSFGSSGVFKSAFVGSRLDLDKLCSDSNERDPGIFSAQSLESIIFDLMEKRAERNNGLRTSKIKSNGTPNHESHIRRLASFSRRILSEYHSKIRKQPVADSRGLNLSLLPGSRPPRKRWVL